MRKSLLVCLSAFLLLVLCSSLLFATSFDTINTTQIVKLEVAYEDGMTYTFRLAVDRTKSETPTLRWVFEKMEPTPESTGWVSAPIYNLHIGE